MREPTEEERRRAAELRAQIEDLRHGVRDPSQPESPREFTDAAAGEAARRENEDDSAPADTTD
jgi:hypothetical protein